MGQRDHLTVDALRRWPELDRAGKYNEQQSKDNRGPRQAVQNAEEVEVLFRRLMADWYLRNLFIFGLWEKATGAYVGAGASHEASLHVQDILRWLIILAIIFGSLLKIVGAPI